MDSQCDFCCEHQAVLYCRADSARLCLFCDRQVHSANLLSRKHIRSLICDNCGREPVTVRCAIDKLALCQDCDWDEHGNCSVSANHQRTPVEGFSGCPAARELASIWGFAIIPNADEEDEGRSYVKESNRAGDLCYPSDWASEPWGTPFGDVMVPNSNPNVLYPVDEDVTEGCGYGRNKYILSKQLLQVYVKDCSEELASDGFNIEELNGNKPEVEVPIIPRAEKQQVIRNTQRKQTDSNKNIADRIENPSSHSSHVAKVKGKTTKFH